MGSTYTMGCVELRLVDKVSFKAFRLFSLTAAGRSLTEGHRGVKQKTEEEDARLTTYKYKNGVQEKCQAFVLTLQIPFHSRQWAPTMQGHRNVNPVSASISSKRIRR